MMLNLGDLWCTDFVSVGSSVPKAKLQKTKKGIARRPIDQLGYIEDTNTLVVLSGNFEQYHFADTARLCFEPH